MKASALFYLMFFSYFSIIGQNSSQKEEYCSFHVTQSEYDATIIPQPLQTSNPGEIHIKVYPYVLRKNDCSAGISLTEAATYLNNLNNHYNPFNIYFFNCGIKEICVEDWIYNEATFPELSNQLATLKSDYSRNDGISIYLGGNEGGGQGISDGLLTKDLMARGSRDGLSYGEGSILAHEMGHSLGLLHTYYPGALGETGGECELVDGSNASIAGDLVIDTPADPWAESVGADCLSEEFPLVGNYDPFSSVCALSTYEPWIHPTDGTSDFYVTQYDSNGDQYPYPTPQAILLNVMTQQTAPLGCLDILTDGQGERINNLIQNAVNNNAPFAEVVYTRISEEMTVTEAVDMGLLTPTTSNQQIILGANLTIDQDYSFDGALIIADPGKTIAVDDSNNLSILSSRACGCSQLWKGITLSQNADLTIIASRIEDAEYAIETSTQNNLTLSRSNFLDNYVGIYHPSATNTSFNFNIFRGNTFSQIKENILPPYDSQLSPSQTKSYAGMLLNENLSTISLSSAYSTNIMSNLTNGVISYNNNLNITNVEFSNIQPNNEYEIEGYGVYAKGTGQSLIANKLTFPVNYKTSFEDCFHGVWTENMNVDINTTPFTSCTNAIWTTLGQNRSINIQNNPISALVFGIGLIQLDGAQDVIVTNNTIDLGSNSIIAGIYGANMGIGQTNTAAISFNTINIGSFGKAIHLNACKDYGVTENIINLLNPNLTPLDFSAIGISLNDCTDSKIACNTIEGHNESNQIGLSVLSSTNNDYLNNEFNRVNTAVFFQSDCNGTDFKTNIFDNNSLSLRLSPTALFGSTSIQNAQDHYGNIWLDTNVPSVAIHEGSFFNIPLSLFNIHESYNDAIAVNYSPKTIISQAPWFILGTGTPESPDNTDCALNKGLKGISGLDIAIANNEVDLEIYEESVLWEAQKSLYKKLDKDANLLANSVDLTIFHSEKENSIIGKLSRVENTSETIYDLPTNLSVQLTSLLDQITFAQVELMNIETQYNDLLSPQEITDIKLLKESIYTDLVNLSNDINFTETTILGNRLVVTNIVKNENDLISCTELIEHNHNTVNRIYLNSIGSGSPYINSNDLTTINNIANQCPLLGGDAVFRARALNSLYYPSSVYDDDQLCLSNGILLMEASDDDDKLIVKKGSYKEAITNNEIKFYPNPADKQLQIHFESSINQKAELYIYNITGAIVVEEILNSTNLSLPINTSSWAEGIYLCKVIFSDGQFFNNKVIISH